MPGKPLERTKVVRSDGVLTTVWKTPADDPVSKSLAANHEKWGVAISSPPPSSVTSLAGKQRNTWDDIQHKQMQLDDDMFDLMQEDVNERLALGLKPIVNKRDLERVTIFDGSKVYVKDDHASSVICPRCGTCFPQGIERLYYMWANCIPCLVCQDDIYTHELISAVKREDVELLVEGVSAIKKREWWHSSGREDWYLPAQSYYNTEPHRRVVHIGTRDSSIQRAEDVLAQSGTKTALFSVPLRVPDSAALKMRNDDDNNDFHRDSKSKRSGKNVDIFLYINKYEDAGSVSLGIRIEHLGVPKKVLDEILTK